MSESKIEAVLAKYLKATEGGDQAAAARIIEEHTEFASELSEFAEMDRRLSVDSPGSQVSRKDSAETLTLTKSFGSSGGSLPPQILGDYEILEEIARGGMGVVYKACDQNLNRLVALKVIRSGQLASEEEVQRFVREAEATAALTHPGIVPIYEVGATDGFLFFTMAYIEGCSLSELAQQNKLPPLEAVRIVHQLCAAVEYAHQAGVIHRDLKPSNVLINQFGQPILIDFGLAKNANRDPALTSQELTATGQLLGTPAYMPPEYAAGRCREFGPGGDVYALGAILYFLAAGQPAFGGPTPFDVLLQVLERRPPKPSRLNRKVNAQLDAVCMRALEKDPHQRYQTAGELEADLLRILADQPINFPQQSWLHRLNNWWRRAPILVAHFVAIGVTTAIVVAFYLLRGESSPFFRYKILLLSGWFVASGVLQLWVYRARWRQVAMFSWLTLDAVVATWLISLASPPRSLLLICYPMMIVASGLFFQYRFVTAMTGLSLLAFLALSAVLGVLPEVTQRPDYASIFACGMIVVGLCTAAAINRVRGLTRVNHHGSN